MKPIFKTASTGLALTMMVSIAMADEVITESLIVASKLLCVGEDCVDGESLIPGHQGVKLKNSTTAILFDDTSGSGEPDRDWQLTANENMAGGMEQFMIEDISAGRIPFTIQGGAQTNSFVIDPLGNIGFGTALPMGDLHINGGSMTTVILEDTSNSSYAWTIDASDSAFLIRDSNASTIPFAIAPGAPLWSLVVRSTGNVGLGTDTPDAPLEVSSDENFTFFRLTAEDAPINQSVDVVFTRGPDDRGQLRYNIVEAGDSPQIPEMTLNADGDMVLTGTLTTMGPTCAAGCDRVFDEGYALPSIREHAELMFANQHLPALGPTNPSAPINLSETLGNVINELEHAHIYIARQQDMIDQQSRHMAELEASHAARIATLTTRLNNIEAAMP